jgi:hypothetical protein
VIASAVMCDLGPTATGQSGDYLAAPADVRERSCWNRRLAVWGALLFLVTLVWNATLVLTTPAIGRFEEHLDLGRRLYRTGSLAAENDPGVLRAPGYPAFVCGVLHIRAAAAAIAGVEDADASWLGEDKRAILFAQCVLWAGAAVLLFVFAAARVTAFPAACVALAFGCNPLALALLGTLSYPALHVVATVVGVVTLISAVARPRVATLVRPVCLVLPPFVWLSARLKRGGAWAPASRFALLFTLGMAGAVLPYTSRNYFVTGEFLLVNAQSGAAVWASTVDAVPADGDHWTTLWRARGVNIYRQITGDTEYVNAVWSAHALELDRAFRRKAWEHIRRRPSLYLRNVLSGLWRFSSDPLTFWPELFCARNKLSRERNRMLGGAFVTGVSLLALPGLILGLRRRDAAAWTIGLVFASLLIAHALTFVTPRYAYPKFPLLLMAFVLTLQALGRRSLPFLRAGMRLPLALTLALGVALWSAVATALTLLL